MKISNTAFLRVLSGVIDRMAAPLDGLALQGFQSENRQSIPSTSTVIILGMERSGTTVLYSLLANHPDFYWLSALDGAFPRLPWTMSNFRRVMETAGRPSRPYGAVQGAIAESDSLYGPSEAYRFWERFVGWDRSTDGNLSDGLDEAFAETRRGQQLVSELYQRLRILGKRRLLIKQPGLNLKVRAVNALFPDSRFVWIRRDPYSNHRSLLRARSQSKDTFWGTKPDGWQTWLSLTEEEQAARQQHSIVVEIKHQIREIDPNLDRVLEIWYEDLTAQPVEVLQRVLKFLGLDTVPILVQATNKVRPETSGSDIAESLSGVVDALLRPLKRG